VSIARFLLDWFLVTVGDRLRDAGSGLIRSALLAGTGRRRSDLGGNGLGDQDHRPTPAALAHVAIVVSLLVIVRNAATAIAPEAGAFGGLGLGYGRDLRRGWHWAILCALILNSVLTL